MTEKVLPWCGIYRIFLRYLKDPEMSKRATEWHIARLILIGGDLHRKFWVRPTASGGINMLSKKLFRESDLLSIDGCVKNGGFIARE